MSSLCSGLGMARAMRSTLESSSQIPAIARWEDLRMSSALHALPGRAELCGARPRSALFRGRQAGADIEATKKSIALRCPIPDPIAVLISVLAGQQDASPAGMAEVPRFVILAR